MKPHRVKNRRRWLGAITLCFAVVALAGEETPWKDDENEAQGYAISLVSVQPAAGTPLVAGSVVEVKAVTEYTMSIAERGQVIMVMQSPGKRGHLGVRMQQSSLPAKKPGGTLSISDTMKVPEDAQEVMVFVALRPDGVSVTHGEIVLRYPVVAKP